MTILTRAKYLKPGRPALARAVVFLLVACSLAGGVYFARRSGNDPQAYSNDFNVYYYAAREVIAGRDPYQRSLGEWTPYLYPPLLAELLVPLALLPVPLAAYIWFVINAAAIVAAAWMSAVLATDARVTSNAWRSLLTAGALVVVLRFVLDNFNLGQVNPVVAALVVAHVYLYARGRKKLSALALVLAASIKLTPVLLLAYHVAKLRLKFAAACVALLIVVTLASFSPFAATGLDSFRVFASRTLGNEQGYDFAYSGNQSLLGAVDRLTSGERSQSPLNPAALVISLALLSFAIFGSVRSESEIGAAAPLCCCLVLLSPLSWKAHFVVLILPVGYLLFQARASTGMRRLLIGSVLVVAFGLFNLTSPHVIGLAASERADTQSLVFLAGLLVFITSIVASLTRKFGKSPSVC